MRLATTVAAGALALGLAGLALAANVPDYVARAVANPARPKTDTDRDAARKPAEVLAFSGVKPGDKVLELIPGSGNFYQINIEAVADPTPPIVAAEDLATVIRRRIQRLLEQMEDISEQEAMDQVYRRLTLYLCGPCYREWIENPTG